jgi:uncharacterized membrane protein
MAEPIVTLLGTLLILAVIVLFFVLPILAGTRARELDLLRARLDRLERELDLLRRGAVPAPSAAVETPAAQTPPPRLVDVLTALPAARPRAAGPAGPDAAAVEAWVGRQGLGWTAVVLLLFATAFFLKYAFENGWIGELGRVALGIVAGCVLSVAGWRFHRHGWRLFSQMLTSAGVMLLYLATFGAFGYYHLLSQEHASIFLVILVFEAGALAVLYEAPAIAVMAVVGGLLNPILLHTHQDQHPRLFTYLAVLDAGVVAVALLRRWPAFATLALIGTQGLFWSWYAEHYQPEKRPAALAFELVVFGLFLANHAVLPLLRRRKLGAEELARVVLNAFFLAVAGYVLLRPDYRAWMGSLALGMAILYTALGWWLLRRDPDDTGHLLAVVGTGLAFVAVVFPMETNAAWIALGWAVEGVVILWFALRVCWRAVAALGAVLLVLAVGRLVFVDTPWEGRAPFVPIFNRYGLPALAVAACILVAAAAARRYSRHEDDLADLTCRVTGMAGVLLVWLILSVETYQFFTAPLAGQAFDLRVRRPEEYLHRMRAAQTSLSVLWAGYAAVVLALGFRLRNRPLRCLALGLFGVTLGKVVLVDMAELPGFYRVAAFFILSVMMGAAAWGYQKVGAARWAAEGEGFRT